MTRSPSKPPRPEVCERADRLIEALHAATPTDLKEARKYIDERCAAECPPLTAMDIVGVLAIEFYELGYRAHHLAEGVIPTSEALLLEMVALENVIVAAPELARAAGVLPPSILPSEDRMLLSFERFQRWQIEVSNPAQTSLMNRFFQVDPGSREDRIAISALRAAADGTHGGTGLLVRNALQRALEELGVLRQGDPPLTREDYFLYLKALADCPVSGECATYRGRDGRDRLGWRQLRTALKRVLRASGELQPGARPPDAPTGDLGEVDTNRRRCVPGSTSGTHGAAFDDVSAAAYIREMRDQLDRHPEITKLLRTSRVAGERAIRMVAEFRSLTDLLDRRDDKAHKAAILYVWFEDRAGSVPGGRKHVAQHCGVSEKQLRNREAAAREDLVAFMRRSG